MKTKLVRFQVAIALSCAIFLPSNVLAQRTGDIPYAEANFTVSNETTKVVLQVQSGSRSMTVYGDGRAELQERLQGKMIQSGVVEFSAQELQNLLQTAIHGGLAEWDSETIQAWVRRESEGKKNFVEGGGSVQISLVLESYRRGSIEETPHAHTFSVRNPDAFARMFPQIKQFAAVTALWQTMREELRQIEGKK